ncbi:MAG: biopolymer transporter ExbD [Anaerohalosphaeraceae bacterium]
MANETARKGLAGQVMSGLMRRGGRGMGLRMTAMIDVIFLLLTFFVLTARFPKPEANLPVVMPKPSTETAAVSDNGPMKIYLKFMPSGCQVTLGETKPIELQQDNLDAGLTAVTNDFLEAAKSINIAENGLELYCEDAVEWDYVVKVYDVLYRSGARKIAFVSQDKQNP